MKDGRELGHSVTKASKPDEGRDGRENGEPSCQPPDCESGIPCTDFFLGRGGKRVEGPPPKSKGYFSPEPEDRLTGLSEAELLQVSLKGRTLGEMSGCFHALLKILVKHDVKPHSMIRSSGGIFPLPENPNGLAQAAGHLHPQGASTLQMLCGALNSYYGSEEDSKRDLSKATLGALEALKGYATDVCDWPEKFEGLRWDQFMAVRGIDYRGEEIKLARSFNWENIRHALPEGIGSIPLVEVCELGTLDYIKNFEDYLIPQEEFVYTKPPRIMVDDRSWEQVCTGLLAKGVCKLIKEDEVFKVHGRPLLNGMFGVSKDEFVDGVEVFRLIMNLVPVNKLCRSLVGDVSTLPAWSGMQSFFLEEGKVLLMSSEDIRCFFYLFEVPPHWCPFMAFGKQVPPSLLPPGSSGAYYLTSRVLPMGFLNSVTIAQHVHRRIARLSLHSMGPGRGPQCELRRDKPLSRAAWLFRVYLDNFDTLEQVDTQLASVLKGQVSEEVSTLRQKYLEYGLPRHPKKAVSQETAAEIQGALVDGVRGRVRPRPSKVLKYVELAWQILQDGRANQKQLQVVCGGFVYCCMFRRALLGLLNRVWGFITELSQEPPVVKRVLPRLVQLELVRFICAVPLAQLNLRLPMMGNVTASDASEYGGGFCQSNGLSSFGAHAAQCYVRGEIPEPEDHVQVLTVGLFDGIAALRVAADVLQLPMAGHISSEVSKEGIRVIEAQFPDSISVGSVEAINEEMVKQWAGRFCNVGVVLVAGGPPCQGVSGLNSDRKGATKDARSKLFVHVKRVFKMVKKHFRWAQTHYLMESVFSMDTKDRCVMTSHMETTPLMVDAGDLGICRRPRLYWISWELPATPYATLTSFGEGDAAYVTIKLHHTVDHSKFLKPGWDFNGCEALPTFTTSRPRAAPGNRPAGLWQCQSWERDRWEADKFRFPPYVYRDQHCLSNSSGELRLPSIAEKEVAMGFPLDYTAPCMPKGQQSGESYMDARHTLVGNSWHVPVVAWLLQGLFYPLGLTPCKDLVDVVNGASPGTSSNLQGFLRRPPMQRMVVPVDSAGEDTLSSKLMTFVSIKGEDLMLQAPTENAIKYHRLRTSVPARLWRWKTVCGWQWAREGSHINALELQAVLTCLHWRLERKRHQQCRFLHLTDSLVTLHCLSRGRSSSRKLRPILARINALLLAGDVHPIWVYVNTKQNPADRPSRRPVQKRCLKRRFI